MKRSKKRSQLAYDAMEARRVLASVFLDGAVLNIAGTAIDDIVSVDIDDAGQIEVADNLNGNVTFAVADVDSIRFFGGDGDDEFSATGLTDGIGSVDFFGGEGDDFFDFRVTSSGSTPITSLAIGHAGDDVLLASDESGQEVMFYGSAGVDILGGGAGDDILVGGADGDFIDGGAGADIIRGNDGDDVINGDEGDDVIFGNDGDDEIDGGNSSIDAVGGIEVAGGNDQIYGGSGDDTLIGNDGDDILAGGEGVDSVFGDAGDDQIYGGSEADELFGGDGDDVVAGQEGEDYLQGHAGADQLFGGTDNDNLSAGDGDDSLYGGEGDDFLTGGAGADELNGYFGNDTLVGNAGDDQLYGGDGNDYLDGSAGEDTLLGHAGQDTLLGGDDSDTLYGGDDADTLDGGESVDLLVGGTGIDTFENTTDDNIIDLEDGESEENAIAATAVTATTVTAAVTVTEAAIVINELMADNDTTIEDPDEAGAFEDWIELYNPGTTAVDLSGFYLTDDVADATQWAFPVGSTIDAGGYLVIWADGDPDQGDAHADFKLSAGGETVALYSSDGTTLIDSVEFGEQIEDVSYGRSPDGGVEVGAMATATPGAANAAVVSLNIDPDADAGGPYVGNVGDRIILNGSASQDDDGSIASYAWDFDGDGLYDDASGQNVTYTATAEGIAIIGLQVTDDIGGTSTDTATVQVLSVGDTVSVWDAAVVDDEAAAFFDDSYVHEIQITFADENWFDALVDSHSNDADDPYFVASFVGDGITLSDVGVRFKGNSSFDGTDEKKSLKIDFNEFDDLSFMGLAKLNLNNNFNDPTMLREKLFYDYASNFVEGVGRAVHTKVYINGEYYGLYTAVEQVDSTFTETHFGEDEDGNLYKGTASDAVDDDPSADFGSDLTYLGTDQAAYEDFYDLKTNETANDYSQLIELIDVLNNTPSGELAEAIEPLLDVDDTLAALALNNLFVNLDSYSGAAHNYYLYDQDSSGQFHHVIWDVNESFGTFTQFLERGQDPVEIDPLWLPASTTQGPPGPGSTTEEESRPLAESLWAVDEYEAEYLNQLTLMLSNGFDVTTASARINELADLIRADVDADPNKQFTTAEFEQNLTTDVSAGNRTVYGLTSFIEDRSSYLATVLDVTDGGPSVNLANGTLTLEGTDGSDKLIVIERGSEVIVKVVSQDQTGPTLISNTYSLADIDDIEIQGFGGDDLLYANGVSLPTTMIGDAGADRIFGGQLDDILVGGDGDDLIKGSAGLDVAIGGTGSDKIFGSESDDLLIGSSTSFDSDLDALELIRAEWTSGNDYATRTANLSGSNGDSGANGSSYLTVGTVSDDGVRDFVFGETDQDWFFFDENVDIAPKKASNELNG